MDPTLILGSPGFSPRRKLHAVMQLKRQNRISTVQNICHPRVMDTTHTKFAPDYCKKGDQTETEWTADGKHDLHHGDNADFWDHGEFVPDGHRSDHTETIARHLNYFEELRAAKKPTPTPPKEMPTLHPWQSDLLETLFQEPDDRTIHWFYDPVGGSGKSFITKIVKGCVAFASISFFAGCAVLGLSFPLLCCFMLLLVAARPLSNIE